MSEPVTHPAFDADEQTILASLKPESEEGQQPAEGSEAAAPSSEAPAGDAAPKAEEAPKPEGETAKAEAPATEAPKPEADKPAEQPDPSGDVRAALRAARRAEKLARSENERLRKELETVQSGKATPSAEITDDELEQMEQDFPSQAKLVRRQRELEAQIAALTQRNAPEPEFQPPMFDPEIQEVIDAVPDLLKWQFDPASQDKFLRATEYDSALRQDPDWKDKPVAERFAEAAARTKRAFGLTPSAAPAAPKPDPAQVIAQAPTAQPRGISDYRGGAPASAPQRNFAQMSDEAVMSALTPED